MKYLFSEHSDKIIEMFKEIGPSTFTCQQCKRTTEYRFNPTFLAYDTNQRTCPTCEANIEKAISEQRLHDKMQAFDKWRKNQEFFIDNMIESANVPVVFQSASLKDLEPEIAEALTTEQSYFIKGNVGVGKSHMAVAIMREYLREIKPEYDEQRKEYSYHPEESMPVFVEVPELLLRIRDTYNDASNESEKDIVNYYSSTPFLVLDDLGSEKASEFSTLMLYLIINRRCTSGKTTIITSNLSLALIEDRLSDRISSRIKGMCKEINVMGNDKRYDSKYEHGVSLAKQQ